MKNMIAMMLAVLALTFSVGVFARGSTSNVPTGVACTVGTNHKCVYPEATMKNKHIFQKLQWFLRKIGR